MNKDFDDCVSYSTSCVPPEMSSQGDEMKKIPHTVIKFPTLFGISKGFTRVDEFWDREGFDRRRRMRQMRNFHLEKDFNLTNAPMKTFNTNQIRSKSVDRFNRSSYNKIMNEFNDELTNKVCYYNLPPSLPRDYNPRTSDRSKSFSRALMALSNRNNSNSNDQDEELSNSEVVFDFNCNNVENRDNDEWINLFFEFPDGHRMRFKTRKKAMLRYSMEAFTARMGYSSIHDLKFIYNGTDVFYNETPSSLNLEQDSCIQVQNR